jgi:dihydroorotase
VVIEGARIVDPRSGIDRIGDVHIADGVIGSIGEGPLGGDAPETERVKADGMLLMPAFTDPHVHFRTPGQEHKETLETGSAAAAAGGYCLVIGMPNTSPLVDGPEMLRGLLARASEESRIPYGQMAAITVGSKGVELSEMGALAEAGACGLTDDGLPVSDGGVMRRALRYQQLAGLTLALHEEDTTLSHGEPMNEGDVSARLGLRGAPGVSESTMVERDLALAELEGARIHIQHVSDFRSVEAIARAKDRGVLVTAEASPHHLLLTDEACSTLDTNMKMNPPLRTERDRLAVIEGLRTGALDCIATDHAPHSADEKSEPFEQAPFGTTGLETSFAVIHEQLVLPGTIDLPTVIERMTAGCIPFGFVPPSLRVGEVANLTLFDMADQWTIGADGWAGRSSNSAFNNIRVSGRIVLTIADGVEVHRCGRIAGGS